MSYVRLGVAIGALVIGLITVTGSLAQGLGRVSAGGPGCPKEGARAVLTGGGSSLRVSFDNFYAASAGARTGDLSRTSCNLAIPMRVPPGKRFAVVAGQFHGSNALPAGAKSVLRVEHFFPGRTGPVVEQTFAGPLRRGFVLDAPLSPVWSRCGGDAILRINASLRVTGGSPPARSALKSGRDGAAAIYRLQWANC
jgi:hypothetical protein